MPSPNMIEAEWEAFRDEVDRQLDTFRRLLSYLDLHGDPPPLLFDQFTHRHTPHEGLRILIEAALEEAEREE